MYSLAVVFVEIAGMRIGDNWIHTEVIHDWILNSPNLRYMRKKTIMVNCFVQREYVIVLSKFFFKSYLECICFKYLLLVIILT